MLLRHVLLLPLAWRVGLWLHLFYFTFFMNHEVAQVKCSSGRRFIAVTAGPDRPRNKMVAQRGDHDLLADPWLPQAVEPVYLSLTYS